MYCVLVMAGRGLLLLRVWVGLVAVIALVNGVQCFLDPQFPQKRIYTLKPEEATPLLSRMFGVWTVLASVVRFSFALFPHNTGLFLSTLYSFLLALAHFLSEIIIYETMPSVSFGSISPLIVAGVSSCWMIVVAVLKPINKEPKKD